MSWSEQVQPIIDRAADGAFVAVGVVLLVLAFVLRWRASRRRHEATNDTRPGSDGPFDAFISYKSQDSEFARRIADGLIASGRRIWFAEYQILLTDRNRFQEAIERGIDRSHYGIAITNDVYADSEHCRDEMARLLARGGPMRILELGLPRQPAIRWLFPELGDSPGLDSQGDVDAAFRFIGLLTGWPIAPRLPPIQSATPNLHRGACQGIGYEVDVSGWTLVDPSFQGGGPCYGHPALDLLWNLQYGAEFDPVLYDARRAGAEDRKDDRALFEAMCEYAEGYFERYGMGEPVGVHLFHLDGVSHFALSYRSGRYWKRRYSLMLIDPQTYKAAEFVFTFQLEGSFADYCRAVEIMDRLVGSFRWGMPDAAADTTRLAPSQAEERFDRVKDDLAAGNKIFDEGMALLKQGRMAEGIARLERVLDFSNLAEMQGAAHFNIGLAHEKSGDLDAAIARYQAAAEANPAQFNAICNLGSIHHRRGDVRSALDAFLRAAEINPRDRITANNVVICYRDLGETEEADEWLARWRALDA